MTTWEKNARYAKKVYGTHIDWKERFYVCPECGQPIYECDWDEDELKANLCPICEFEEDECE